MNRKIATTMKYLKTRYTPEELSWMNREHVGDRTGYLRRWYDSMTIPVPDDDALIPDFNYKIRPQDVHVTKQYNKVDRTIDDIIAKMNRDSEPPINLSYYTTKVPDIIDHNAIAHSLINSRREQTEDNRMDETALLNLGFTQQEITDLFGKAHTLDNIGISSNLQQNLDKINALNKFNAKLNVIEPGNTINNIKNVYNVTKDPSVPLVTDDVPGEITSGDESDSEDGDRVKSKLDPADTDREELMKKINEKQKEQIYEEDEDEEEVKQKNAEEEEKKLVNLKMYNAIVSTNVRNFKEKIEPLLKSTAPKQDRYKVANAYEYVLFAVKKVTQNPKYGENLKPNVESIKKMFTEIVEYHASDIPIGTDELAKLYSHFEKQDEQEAKPIPPPKKKQKQKPKYK